MTIVLSAWVIPLLVSIVLFAWALLTPANGAWDFAPLFRIVGALIGALVAWFVWALLR